MTAPTRLDVPALLERIGDRTVVMSVSGGKDSAAGSLWLNEHGIEHRRVFADTGWEHPRLYEYLRGELTRVLGSIEEVRGPRTLPELVKHKGMFPSRKFRFCTQFLKVYPLSLYFDSPDEEVVNVVGIRAEESAARANVSEWEECTVHMTASQGGPLDLTYEIWRPLLRWTVDDVIAIHKRHGLAPNPLYLMGASRVGCWPCINVRKNELRLLAETDPNRIDEIRDLERDVAAAAAARYKRYGEDFESLGYATPTFFQAAIPDAPGGRRGMWPIDRAVEWSRTARGGRQLEMFHDPADGCVRWGMCEGHAAEAAE